MFDLMFPTVQLLFEVGCYSNASCYTKAGYVRFDVSNSAASIRGRLLFKCDRVLAIFTQDFTVNLIQAALTSRRRFRSK